MKGLRKLFLRLRTLLWTALTILTVLAAVVVGVGKLLMPYSVHYQPEFEAWLSKSFNQPVRVESFSGEWKAFGPRISLRGLTLMPEGMQSEIAIERAALDIKPLNVLVPGRPLYSFRIIGADLSLQRASDGRYVLSGLGVSDGKPGGGDSPRLRDVALNGEVRLQDVSLSFDDPERGIHMLLRNVDGRLKAAGRDVSAEVRASITDKGQQKVVGDLDVTVKVRLDGEQRPAKAEWHIKTGELILGELVRQLPHHSLIPASGKLNAEVWGQWQSGSPQEIQGVVDLREAQLNSQSGPLVIDHLNSRFNFQFTTRKNWRMDLSDMLVGYAGDRWQSERFSLARNLGQNLGLWVSADYLELEFPLLLTRRIMANYGTPWPAAFPKYARGSVSDFDLVLDSGWHVEMTNGQLENGHFWGWDKGPDVEGINASIDLASGAGDVRFGGPSVKLDWSRTFRRPLLASFDKCKLEVQWKNKSDWRFDLNYCRVENDDISAFGRVRMAWGEGKPDVDINVAMARGDISRFGDYWPENIMSEKSLRWLRSSLIGGQVVGGRYSMVGDLDNFPFLDHDGRLQATATGTNVSLRYADGWPDASKVDAKAYFEGRSMVVEGFIGESAGAVVDKLKASIEDFKNPVLDVTYQTSTGLPELVRFIRATPLLDGLEMDPEQFIFEGDAEISGHLHSELGTSNEPLQVEGNLVLKGNKFTELASGVVIEGITGNLGYDRNGLQASGLPGSYKGFPVNLDVTSNWGAQEVFRTHVYGSLPVEAVVPAELFELEPLFHRATGTSRWDVSVSVKSVEGNEDREVWLEVYSGLEGVSIDMPAPLEKTGESSMPLVVRYPIRAGRHLLTADFPGKMQLMMELTKEDSRPVRAAVELGGKVKALPDPGLFDVNGSSDTFDMDGWIDLAVDRFSESDQSDGLTLQSAQLDAARVEIFDRHFDDVGLSMTYEDGIITGVFDAQDINGTVRYYKNEEGAHSMSGEFERLVMPDPVTEGMTVETDPANLPEMHFYCNEFTYLGIDLGETRIEGYPVSNGFHIESVEAQSPSFIFNARGDWISDADGQRSDFNIRISSESLGSVLEAMDISSAMRGGQTLVHFDAWWEGPPAAFALERLNGEMDVSVVQGNILTADSGAGRMLGLLSLSELPRRLSMDFRDVFDEGFSFDEASGTMILENGVNHTDDLTLSSTIAEITIIGSTDLVAKTFDYEFAVKPGVSKTLPVIGAIAGGPIGAAAGLALQAILRDALGEAAEARYTIKGPWEDPQIEPVDKQEGSGVNDENQPPAETDEKQPDIQPIDKAGETGLQPPDGTIYD